MSKKEKVYLILHNIRSAHNVGSIFRTADAAGVENIFLTGYTPTPVDRFGRQEKQIEKTALGAEKVIFWEHYTKLSTLITKLKKEKVQIIALEQAHNAKNYTDVTPAYPFALLVGNEVRGISPQTLNKSDEIMEIPMRGTKESLNVSVATGIALFHLVG